MYFVRKEINSFFVFLLISLLITRESWNILYIKELDATDRLIRTKSDSELFFITLEPIPKIDRNIAL